MRLLMAILCFVVYVCLLIFTNCATVVPPLQEGSSGEKRSIDDGEDYMMPVPGSGYLDPDGFYIPGEQPETIATAQALPDGWDFIPSSDLDGYYFMIGRFVDMNFNHTIRDTFVVSSGDTARLNFSWRQPPTFDDEKDDVEMIIEGNAEIDTFFISNTSLSYVAPDSVNYTRTIEITEGAWFFRVAAKHPTHGTSVFSDLYTALFIYDEENPPSVPVYFQLNIAF